MRVFPSRDVLATKLFVKEVLKHCDERLTFAVDSAPWLRGWRLYSQRTAFL